MRFLLYIRLNLNFIWQNIYKPPALESPQPSLYEGLPTPAADNATNTMYYCQITMSLVLLHFIGTRRHK